MTILARLISARLGAGPIQFCPAENWGFGWEGPIALYVGRRDKRVPGVLHRHGKYSNADAMGGRGANDDNGGGGAV